MNLKKYDVKENLLAGTIVGIAVGISLGVLYKGCRTFDIKKQEEGVELREQHLNVLENERDTLILEKDLEQE
ncbi:MAG: hypothetical protein ACRCTZ_09370 [Sarcina sp.]